MAVQYNNRLSWFCQLAVLTVWWLSTMGEMQTQNQSPRHFPGLCVCGGGGGGQWSQMTSA